MIDSKLLLRDLIILMSTHACLLAAEKAQNCQDLPVVYTSKYNITLYGVQKLHPFDSEKYGRIVKQIKKDYRNQAPCFYKPEMPSEQDLLLAHTPEYLKSLRHSSTIAAVTELYPLRILPAFMLRQRIIRPMLYATGGSIRGAELAMTHGWAINLSGGYHHAKANEGAGFCAFSDIAIAIMKLWGNHPDLKVLIVDLDAHQGNGYASIFENEKRVFILDAYNGLIYPKDIEAGLRVNYTILLDHTDTERYYMQKVDSALVKAIQECRPDFILYNAGTDVYIRDRLGRLRITKEGIVKRDEMVFRKAMAGDIPILMVLSGGYHKHSAGIVASSVENLLWGKLGLALKINE